MRGSDGYNESLFTTVKLEDFVPTNHPVRPIRTWMNKTLSKMDEHFSAMYEANVKGGRPSIAPEKLMRAVLLQVNRPGFELTPRSWTNFKESHGEVRDRVQAPGRQ